jgi:RNA polymerase sigma-70 factor (ECF subfamily)
MGITRFPPLSSIPRRLSLSWPCTGKTQPALFLFHPVRMSQESSVPASSASSDQDRMLVEQALAGKASAYQVLMDKYRPALYRHIQRMVKQQDELDDLVQECFIKAFTALDSYSSDFAFSTWLYKIATNHTIDHLRKRKLPTFSIDKPVQTKDGELEYEIPDLTYRPDRHIVEDQRRQIIQDAINALPPKYHQVIVMRHQQEMSYEEIAEELDLPLGTVKAHIFRARALLYKFLRDQRGSL